MKIEPALRIPLIGSLLLHGLLAFVLFFNADTKPAVLEQQAITQKGTDTPIEKKETVIKAEAIDSKEVLQALQSMKAAKQEEARLAKLHQDALDRKALEAKRARLAELQKIKALQLEAIRLKDLHKKQMQEEEAKLKKLTEERVAETKRLAVQKQKQEALAKAAKDAALKKQALEEQKKAALLASENAAQKAKMAGEVNRYKALIQNAIATQWIIPEHANKNAVLRFHIRLAPGGTVLEAKLIQSSGDPILDRSAETAIYKASPLPVPESPAIFAVFRDNVLTVRPMNVRG